MGKARAKMKSSRAARKRLRFTKSGKIKRSKAYGSHILTKKTAKRMRKIKKSALVSSADKKRISRLLPYK